MCGSPGPADSCARPIVRRPGKPGKQVERNHHAEVVPFCALGSCTAGHGPGCPRYKRGDQGDRRLARSLAHSGPPVESGLATIRQGGLTMLTLGTCAAWLQSRIELFRQYWLTGNLRHGPASSKHIPRTFVPCPCSGCWMSWKSRCLP